MNDDKCPFCDIANAGMHHKIHGPTCKARQLIKSQAECVRLQSRVLWLTIATTAEPEDPALLVDWLRGRRTHYEEKWKQALSRVAELEAVVLSMTEMAGIPPEVNRSDVQKY
jgi:hypothetical protein